MKKLSLLLFCLALILPATLFGQDYLFLRTGSDSSDFTSEILRIDLNTGAKLIIYSEDNFGFSYLRGLAVDSVRKKVYWISDFASQEIFRSNFDGSELELFLTPSSPVASFDILEIDSLNGYLYFTYDGGFLGRISVNSSPEDSLEIMITEEVVMEMACDPLTGVLYLMSYSSQLVRLNPDGSEVILETIADTGADGMTYDPVGHTVYISFTNNTNSLNIFSYNVETKSTQLYFSDVGLIADDIVFDYIENKIFFVGSDGGDGSRVFQADQINPNSDDIVYFDAVNQIGDIAIYRAARSDDPPEDPTDRCPNDPAKTAPGACGCGTPDADLDGNGTPDCNDPEDADPPSVIDPTDRNSVEDFTPQAFANGQTSPGSSTLLLSWAPVVVASSPAAFSLSQSALTISQGRKKRRRKNKNKDKQQKNVKKINYKIKYDVEAKEIDTRRQRTRKKRTKETEITFRNVNGKVAARYRVVVTRGKKRPIKSRWSPVSIF